jgi:hypothetical protein
MKINAIALTLISLSLFLFSCDVYNEQVKPSAAITTRNEAFTDYNMIEASHAFQVYVNFSDTEESIEIEANENLHQYIEVTNVNDVLHIGLRDQISVRGSATLKAYITTKHVSSYSGSGATSFIIESPLISEDVHVYLSGASVFNGELQAVNVVADLSGASVMNISGLTDIFDIEASGASVFKGYGFEAKKLEAQISGASNISITVEDEINIEASGASSLNYKGNATVKSQNLSGASSIRNTN